MTYPDNVTDQHYVVECSVVERSRGDAMLHVPTYIRERHLTPGKCDAHRQAVGDSAVFTVWSERDDLRLVLPLNEWRTTGGTELSLGTSSTQPGYIYLGGLSDSLKTEDTSNGLVVDAAVFPFDAGGGSP